MIISFSLVEFWTNYSPTLLTTWAIYGTIWAINSPLAFIVYTGVYNYTRERKENVMNRNKKSSRLIGCVLAVLLAAGACIPMTGCNNGDSGTVVQGEKGEKEKRATKAIPAPKVKREKKATKAIPALRVKKGSRASRAVVTGRWKRPGATG